MVVLVVIVINMVFLVEDILLMVQQVLMVEDVDLNQKGKGKGKRNNLLFYFIYEIIKKFFFYIS